MANDDEGRSMRDVQQNFAESLGFGNEIIWDLLSSDQSEFLKEKIKQLIPDYVPPPTTDPNENNAAAEVNETTDLLEHLKDKEAPEADNVSQAKTIQNKNNEEKEVDEVAAELNNVDLSEADKESLKKEQERLKGQRAIDKLRQTLFEKVWAQRKYTNKNSLSAIIYILVTKQTDVNLVEQSREYSLHPVIRTRKCVASTDSTECCMIFIDETGRVYQNFEAYISNNTLPEGIMLAPKRGIYTFDRSQRVELVQHSTPASKWTKKLLGYADTTTAVGGFLSACVPIAAVLTLPVAAPVMAGAAGVGLVAAGYSSVRSGATLYDRNQHEESINITDRQARNSWIGFAAGLVGLGASGATRAVTTAAATGREISLATQWVVNGMNISSIVLSGTGVSNGVFELVLKYKDEDSVSKLDMLQLAASLVLFTHSVRNFRMASSIVSETQNTTIRQFREGLSNRQRRMFDKMSKETIRIQGNARGRVDIVRSVNDVPSKQQFSDLFKINKQLNARNVRPSFAGAAASEGVLLNNEVLVNTQDLRASVQHNVGADVLGQVTQNIPKSHQTHEGGTGNIFKHQQLLFVNPNLNQNAAANAANDKGSSLSTQVLTLRMTEVLIEGTFIALSDFGTRLFDHIVNAESFESIITSMAVGFSAESFRFVMNLARLFMDVMLDELETVLKMFITTESVIYRMVKFILEKYENIFYEFLETKAWEIIEAVKSYFMTLNPNSFPNLLKKCPTCVGFFAINE